MIKRSVNEFFSFRRMLIPTLVRFIFWIGVAAVIVMGFINFFQTLWLQGLILIILGPLVVRMVCEYVIVLFTINDTLTDIKDMAEARSKNPPPPTGI